MGFLCFGYVTVWGVLVLVLLYALCATVLCGCCAMFSVSTLSCNALLACPLHAMHIVSVPGVGGAMCLLVAPTYIVSVFIQSYPADSVLALLPFSLVLALFSSCVCLL